MSTPLRLLSVCGLFVIACSTPEASHLKGSTGGAGTSGAAGSIGPSGTAGSIAPTGTAGSIAPTGTAGTGIAGDGGGAGAAGTNGTAGDGGMAGSTAGTTGTAGSTAGTTGTAGSTAGTTGTAGSTAGTTGTAGSTAGTTGTTGTAGSTAGTTGTAGSTAGTTGTAGSTAGTTGTAGTGASGTYSNWCSPVHWTYLFPTNVNAMDFAANVVDKNIASRWSTGANQAPGQFFQIDFGGTVSLTQVVLDTTNNANDYPKGYDAGLSANGTTFVSVGAGAGTMALITLNFGAATGRYLRIAQTGTVNNWWSIDELRLACTVPGNNTGLIDPYDPAYWKASASKTPGGYPVIQAIDGDSGTRWSTGVNMAAGDTFTVDTGAPVMISGVTYDNGGADFPVAYKLEVSTDCAAYTQVATGAGMPNLTKITFPKQNVRCFRITQTATTGTNWWSIYAITTQM